MTARTTLRELPWQTGDEIRVGEERPRAPDCIFEFVLCLVNEVKKLDTQTPNHARTVTIAKHLDHVSNHHFRVEAVVPLPPPEVQNATQIHRQDSLQLDGKTPLKQRSTQHITTLRSVMPK